MKGRLKAIPIGADTGLYEVKNNNKLAGCQKVQTEHQLISSSFGYLLSCFPLESSISNFIILLWSAV